MASHTKISKFKRCTCGFPFARRISWTKENPGRQFNTCKFFDPDMNWRECNKFKWIDEPEMVDWQRKVTNTLIEEKRHLSTEIKILTSRVFAWNMRRNKQFQNLKG